jgi:periplasmic protein TonB
MKRAKQHLFATCSMIGGGSLVLGIVFAMNAFSEPPPEGAKAPAADFHVEKQTPPKPPPRKKEPERRAVKPSSAPRAPAPDLGSALSGVSFDLPGMQTADLGRLGEKLLGDTSKKTVMTADVVDTPPTPSQRVQPEFPEKARQRGIQGYVTLKVKIRTDGSVDAVRVVDASPRGVFEEPAIASIKRWQFKPGIYQGDPVEVWVNQTMRFELN